MATSLFSLISNTMLFYTDALRPSVRFPSSARTAPEADIAHAAATTNTTQLLTFIPVSYGEGSTKAPAMRPMGHTFEVEPAAVRLEGNFPSKLATTHVPYRPRPRP